MDTRAIGEPGIDQRLREIDAATQRRDEALDEHEDLLGVAEPDRRRLDATVAFDPHASGAIHHHLAHALVAKKRRELTESEEPVVEVPLERPKLAARERDALGGGRLAEQRTELVAAWPAIRRLAQPEQQRALESLADRAHVASIASRIVASLAVAWGASGGSASGLTPWKPIRSSSVPSAVRWRPHDCSSGAASACRR